MYILLIIILILIIVMWLVLVTIIAAVDNNRVKDSNRMTNLINKEVDNMKDDISQIRDKAIQAAIADKEAIKDLPYRINALKNKGIRTFNNDKK